ncbi:MAG: hypothetical protein U0169_12820 [Polyangiaceae bacterium]
MRQSRTTNNAILSAFVVAGLAAAACAEDKSGRSLFDTGIGKAKAGKSVVYNGGTGGTGGTGGSSGGGGYCTGSGGCSVEDIEDKSKRAAVICGEYKVVIANIMNLYRNMASRYTFMTSEGVHYVSGESGPVEGWECLPTNLRSDVQAAGFSPGQCFPPGTTWSIDKAAVHEILAANQWASPRLPDGPDADQNGIPDEEPYRISLKDLATGVFASDAKFAVGSQGGSTTLEASFLQNANAVGATDYRTYAADAGESPFGTANGFGRCIVSGAQMAAAGINTALYDDAGLDNAGNTPPMPQCKTIGHLFYSTSNGVGTENDDYGRGAIDKVTSHLDGGAYFDGGIVVETSVLSDRARYKEWRRFLQYLAYVYVKFGWGDTPGGGPTEGGNANAVPHASSSEITHETNVLAPDGGAAGAYEMLATNCGGAIAKVWEEVGLNPQEMAAKAFIHGVIAHDQHEGVRNTLVHYFKRFGVVGLTRAHGSSCVVSGSARGCSDVFLDPPTLTMETQSSTTIQSIVRAQVGRGTFGASAYPFEVGSPTGKLPRSIAATPFKILANEASTNVAGTAYPSLIGAYDSTTPYGTFEALGVVPTTVKSLPFQRMFNGVRVGPVEWRNLAQANAITGSCKVLPCSFSGNFIMMRE